MYEKPTAGARPLETKHGTDPLAEQRLPVSHCCEDICGKLNTILKYLRFCIANKYMKILIQLYKAFLKSHVKHLFLFSVSEC